jgi:ribokinase
MCQLETPLEAVEAALKAAYSRGVVTMLDPAPASALSRDVLSCVTILTPNQTEAAIVAGFERAPETAAEAEAAARELQRRGAHTVIVKMGSQGCVVVTEAATHVKAGFRVDVKDTTAAGDTFNGALAAALARGAAIDDAAHLANAAAALSVTKPGASASVPRYTEVEEFLRVAASTLS